MGRLEEEIEFCSKQRADAEVRNYKYLLLKRIDKELTIMQVNTDYDKGVKDTLSKVKGFIYDL